MRNAILYSIVSLLLFGCSFGNGDIVVIPKNFKGYIIIIYNQKSGALPKYEGKKRVYEIPQNGVLRVQNKIDTDWREPTEYYYEKITTGNKLPSFDISKEIPVGVNIVGFAGASGNANKDSAGKERVSFSFFFIGTKSEIEQYKEQAEKLDIVKLAE